MKIQDVMFIISLSILLYYRSPRLFAGAGIAALLLSMPLFYFWVFFTAERLTHYAVGFFLLSVVFHLVNIRKATASL